MKLSKYLLPIVVAVFGFMPTLAATTDDNLGADVTSEQQKERDVSAITDLIKSRRKVSLLEKGAGMMLSGTIQTTWKHIKARTHGKKQRGLSTVDLRPRPSSDGDFGAYPTNEFDVEANVMLDWKEDRSWASIQVKMDNSAGIRGIGRHHRVTDNRNVLRGSGTLDKFVLRKAYFGYNIMDQGTRRVDLEFGRRRFFDVFDSEVQFDDYFDGILARFTDSIDAVGDFSAKIAGFVIDQNSNHFGGVGEIGLGNVADSGVDLKYSLIDWKKEGKNRYGHKHVKGSKFVNSQFTVAYNLPSTVMGHTGQVYGAFIRNHAAKKTHYLHHKKEASAYYAGYRMGEIVKAGDWAFDTRYEWVGAQAVPEKDCSGIARHLPRKISMWNNKSQGYTNYQGWVLQATYAITPNFTITPSYERATEKTKRIGGKHRSYKFELNAEYAF